MSCCNQRRKEIKSEGIRNINEDTIKKKANAIESSSTSNNMVQITYIGSKTVGLMGPVTRQKYYFSPHQRTQWVNFNDVHYILRNRYFLLS
jgi:hypothetical protein